MSDLFSLAGRVALVTGASRGLGFAMAEALARHGATVALNSRHPDEVAAAAQKLADQGFAATALPFDVTDAAAARGAIEGLVSAHGRFDILVNNAGVQHRQPLTEWEDADFRRVLEINLTSCFQLSREAARVMLPRKFGRIISTGSVAAILGRPTIHAYVAAKAGLHGLTRTLARELGPAGILVNVVMPGFTLTERNAGRIPDERRRQVEQASPIRRILPPEEVVPSIVFLCSAVNTAVTGEILRASGGIT